MSRSARSMRGRMIVVLAGVLVPLGPRGLRAAVPDGEHEARKHHQTAEARFRAGLFAEALAEYQAGYQVLPLPGFLINIAQCYRRLGDLKMASGAYRRFTAVAPASPLAPQIRALIVEMDKRAIDFDNARQSGVAPGHGNDDEVMPFAVFLNPPGTDDRESDGDQPPPPLIAQPAPAVEAAQRGTTRWWLWGPIGAAVVGGAVAAIILSTGGGAAAQEGSLATLRR